MCRHKSYGLTEDRKKAILDIQFPDSGNKIKKARMMLGCGVFFSPFIKNYSDLVSHIPDMTKTTFDWTEANGKRDYRAI
jgi:hypothetical protein